MNNEQFRKLMLGGSAKPSGAKDGSPAKASSPSNGSSLGSRQRSSVPMTPRSFGGAQADFARQLAERNQATRPQKTFKTSAPKGSKLATGYVDRAKDLRSDDADDRAERLAALEEALKKEEIDQATFDRLRFEIAGGDLESTHLVKGLDFKLLARIRRGDDLSGSSQAEVDEDKEEPEDVDDEFEQLEQQEVQAVAREKGEKKGQLSTVSLVPGKKRTRDQILAELKASRQAAKAQQESALGGRFAKIGAKKMPGSRIERDSKGREVLIIIDEDGHEKRKVRKIRPGEEPEDSARNDLPMPDKNAKPLGMEVPEHYRKREAPEEDEDEDVDIFDGVGDDYDPLAGIDDSDSDSDSADEDGEAQDAKPDKQKDTEEGEASEGSSPDRSMAPPPPPPKGPAASGPRNYFQGSKTGLVSAQESKTPSMSDPAIMAAIKRAAALKGFNNNNGEDEDEEDEDAEKARAAKAGEERRKKLLQDMNRDDEDLDMGFGTSRFEDEEEFEDSKVKLSVWDGDGGDDDDGQGGRGGKSKRKRGPKKRKGDANSAADVLRVMEQRKKP